VLANRIAQPHGVSDSHPTAASHPAHALFKDQQELSLSLSLSLSLMHANEAAHSLIVREIFENQQEITTLTVIWARQLVSPQPKLGPVPREPAPLSSTRSGGLAERERFLAIPNKSNTHTSFFVCVCCGEASEMAIAVLHGVIK